MNRNLSQALFHGTPVKLNVGDVISPRSHGAHDNVNYGVNPTYGEETENYAYATNDLEEAKHFGGHEGTVYRVEPIGDVKSRRLYKSLPEGAPPEAKNIKEYLSTTGFKVIGEHREQ